MTSGLQSVFTAFAWVLLGLGSLASTVAAMWVTLSLARSASQAQQWETSEAWLWLIAIIVTLGIPFALATWKHQGDARRLSLTMAWLPMLWNTGGLLFATQLIPDLMGTALRGQGAWVAADRVGDTHSATRVMSALGHHAADVVDPQPLVDAEPITAAPTLRLAPSPGVELAKAIGVPFTEEGTAILVDVELEGPQGATAKLPYLFDTGASFTTISSETAAALGIVVPADAPMLTFNTASGPRESKMVHLPALHLGEVTIEGLLVSVCDGCVNESHVGLLGHNVMQRFFSWADYKNRRMLLIPRTGDEAPNRAYDIEPVVDLQVEGAAEVWLGRVRWILQVENRGTVPLTNVTPVVRFADGPSLRGEAIDLIPPGEMRRSLVEGRASIEGKGESRGHYTLGLAEAYW